MKQHTINQIIRRSRLDRRDARVARVVGRLGVDLNTPDERAIAEQARELLSSSERNAIDPTIASKLICSTLGLTPDQLRAIKAGDEADDDDAGVGDDSDDDAADDSSDDDAEYDGIEEERELRSSQKTAGHDPDSDECRQAREDSHVENGISRREARKLARMDDADLYDDSDDDSDDDDDDDGDDEAEDEAEEELAAKPAKNKKPAKKKSAKVAPRFTGRAPHGYIVDARTGMRVHPVTGRPCLLDLRAIRERVAQRALVVGGHVYQRVS